MVEPNALEDIKRFLKEHSILGLLNDEDLGVAVKESTLRYYARGSKIIDGGAAKALYVVYKGVVRLQSGGVYEYLEEGDVFGLDLLLKGSLLSTVEAVEDTICLTLKEDVFWSIYRKYPALARLLDLMVKGRGIRAYEESFTAYSPLLYERRVAEVIKRDPVVCLLGTLVKDAAKLMSERHVSSIIVVDEQGRPIGIVTDADLRRALASMDRVVDKPVDLFMSKPLVKIDGDAPCWEALVTMVERGVKYLPVVKDHKLLGVITIWDLSGAQLQGPALIAREIDDAFTVEELGGVMGRIVEAVKVMHREGVDTSHVAKMLTSLYDRMAVKAIRLAEEELLRELSMKPPVNYAWVAMGSEGRREQLLKTDQDNALIYEDPPRDRRDEVAEYFRMLAVKVASKLNQLGFPKCPHGFTADNPRWNKPLSEWYLEVKDWVSKLPSKPENVMLVFMFSDARCVYGSASLVDSFRSFLVRSINADKRRLTDLARNVLVESPPISFFRRFVVEKDGTKEGRVDVKVRGLTIIVNAVKVLSIDQGVMETNTLDRLNALASLKAIKPELKEDLSYAFNFLMRLRLREQLKGLEQLKRLNLEELPSGRYVTLDNLTKHERAALREVFKVIRELQSLIAYKFGIEFSIM